MSAQQWIKRGFFNFSLLWLLALCAPAGAAPAAAKGKAADTTRPAARQFTVPAINDIYNIEGGMRAKVARSPACAPNSANMASRCCCSMRAIFFPSSMSNVYQGEQMIDVMNMMSGSAGFDPYHFITFGNHEFDKKSMKFAGRLAAGFSNRTFTGSPAMSSSARKPRWTVCASDRYCRTTTSSH